MGGGEKKKTVQFKIKFTKLTSILILPFWVAKKKNPFFKKMPTL